MSKLAIFSNLCKTKWYNNKVSLIRNSQSQAALIATIQQQQLFAAPCKFVSTYNSSHKRISLSILVNFELATFQKQLIQTGATKFRNYSTEDGFQTDLTYNQLMSMVKSDDIQLFDLRHPEEIGDTGMIPKATNLPMNQLVDAFQLSPDEFKSKYGVKMPDKGDTNIVFSCLAGIRSRNAMDILHHLGYSRARHYVGGWDEYSNLSRKS